MNEDIIMNKVQVSFPAMYQKEYGLPETASMILVSRYADRAQVKAEDTSDSIDIPARWIKD